MPRYSAKRSAFLISHKKIDGIDALLISLGHYRNGSVCLSNFFRYKLRIVKGIFVSDNTKVVDVRKADVVRLPPTQKTFHITYTDPDSGHIYGGDFTVRRLTLESIRRLAIRRAELNGGMPEKAIDDSVLYINTMLAHLEQAIVKAPEWWQPSEFYSAAVIQEVYAEVMQFEDSFRKAIRKETSGVETSSSE